jgi:antitoxin component of MazEF toxin-antitoxin module
LGIIIPKKVLQNIGIGKGDDIVIDIDIELLRRQKRIALIEELKGSLKHLRGDEPWDCSDTDVDEVDKPEYKELLD